MAGERKHDNGRGHFDGGRKPYERNQRQELLLVELAAVARQQTLRHPFFREARPPSPARQQGGDPAPIAVGQMSSSNSSCSAIDLTTFLMAMISLTMSRISSRAASGSNLASWFKVDHIDQCVEDGCLDVAVVLGADMLGGLTLSLDRRRWWRLVRGLGWRRHIRRRLGGARLRRGRPRHAVLHAAARVPAPVGARRRRCRRATPFPEHASSLRLRLG
jgi:hypothetical protein